MSERAREASESAIAPEPPPRVGPRAELKFHVELARTAEVVAWCERALSPDPHAAGPEPGLYLVESVYFDTPDLHALEDPAFPKYRARRYDGADESLHLEEKFSHAPRVWKRRAPIGPAALGDLVARRGGVTTPHHAWFADRFAKLGLRPTLLVRYTRRAFVGPGDLRVTLDTDVEVAPVEGQARFAPSAARRRLALDALLEVKFHGAAPPRAAELLARHGEPVGFSKYRSGMRAGS